MRLLNLMLNDFFPKEGTTQLDFVRTDDEIWFLLDKRAFTAQQATQIINILNLSTRHESDFLAGRRFEVMVEPKEVGELLALIGDRNEPI